MTLLTSLLLLRSIHDLAAATLVGSVIFNYFLLRPALRLIPPAHALVITRRVGQLSSYIDWTALVLLFVTGLLRLYYTERLGFVFTLDLFAHGPGRSLALMIFFWFLALIISLLMTPALRTKLMPKLLGGAISNPPAGEKNRTTQEATYLDRLQLASVVAVTLALIAGASIAYGGLF